MIDRQFANFLEEGLGIHIATRDERLQPSGARGLAVKVEDDGVHLTVFVAKIAVNRILADLQSNSQAAVVFGRPIDDRSAQVKGIFVDMRPARASERDLVIGQWEGFRDQLERIGIPRETSAAWVTWPAVAIKLKATALFEQTPGPQAGARLG